MTRLADVWQKQHSLSSGFRFLDTFPFVATSHSQSIKHLYTKTQEATCMKFFDNTFELKAVL